MSFSGIKTKTVALAVAALSAGSAFGYWGYIGYQQRELRNTVTDLVKNTSLQVRDGLSSDRRTVTESPDSLLKLYDDALAVDANYRRLHGMDASPVGELGDAADDYLLTSREIMLRWASSHRYRGRLFASIQALRSHMHADDRTGAWVSTAVRAKERVEEDYRDYRIATNALRSLLESFPASRSKMALYVDATLLADDALIEEARKQVLDASRQAAEEVQSARQLSAYR